MRLSIQAAVEGRIAALKLLEEADLGDEFAAAVAEQNAIGALFRLQQAREDDRLASYDREQRRKAPEVSADTNDDVYGREIERPSPTMARPPISTTSTVEADDTARTVEDAALWRKIRAESAAQPEPEWAR